MLWYDAFGREFAPIRRLSDLPEKMPPASPRITSPMERLNDWTHGGIYGVTSLGGDPGSGKSFFALATAYDASFDGDWDVVYLAGEMTENQILQRVHWLSEKRQHSLEDVRYGLRNFFHIYEIMGLDLMQLCDTLVKGFMGSRRGLLVVDSVNSIVNKLSHGDTDYWRTYQTFLDAIIAMRRVTEGRFAAIMLSELNKQGASKGGRLEYESDLFLNFKNTSTPRVCSVTVDKNREQGEDGKLGSYMLGKNGRFIDMTEFEDD